MIFYYNLSYFSLLLPYVIIYFNILIIFQIYSILFTAKPGGDAFSSPSRLGDELSQDFFSHQPHSVERGLLICKTGSLFFSLLINGLHHPEPRDAGADGMFTQIL